MDMNDNGAVSLEEVSFTSVYLPHVCRKTHIACEKQIITYSCYNCYNYNIFLLHLLCTLDFVGLDSITIECQVQRTIDVRAS